MENKIDYSDFYKVKNLLQKGENVFVTGSAGTGKSFILNLLKEFFKDDIVITATTGVAAGNIDGSTIHSWSKIQTMQIPFPDIIWKCNRKNIIQCKILAIDEISMLSSFTLNYLDKLFKAVRRNNFPFGGIQVVCFGDFLQLPPVSQKEETDAYEDKGKFCFESEVWQDLNFKTVYLTKIHRQKDVKFCNVLNNFRMGCLSQKDIDVIKSRKTSPNLVQNKLHLYPTKRQSDNYNQQQLNNIKSPTFYYESIDSIEPEQIKNGRTKAALQKSLNKNIQAGEVVTLKKGCRVMCLKNYPFKNIYNGSCGTVVDLTETTVTVNFDNGQQSKFNKVKFEYFENETYIGYRIQLPLKLAYATTIHKAQGLTLDEVVIDCYDSFAAGQVYVGLSRVRSLENLYIIGFNERKVYANIKAQKYYSELKSQNEIKDTSMFLRLFNSVMQN
jgi:ATP-dependent exoDNAse (exonuclease V) alpha subunit